ncbi:MAG: hypothetical protein DDT19_02328 [Syntrophomonadaceae bacterium]|nr:hypothetical protein [Bacillota bacterium]
MEKSMKSEWRVSSNVINDRRMYIVYRLLNTNDVHYSGNREEYGRYMADRTAAIAIADKLNSRRE